MISAVFETWQDQPRCGCGRTESVPGGRTCLCYNVWNIGVTKCCICWVTLQITQGHWKSKCPQWLRKCPQAASPATRHTHRIDTALSYIMSHVAWFARLAQGELCESAWISRNALLRQSRVSSLKHPFSANPSHHSLLYLLQDWPHGFPGLFADTSELIRLSFFCFFPLFFTFKLSVPCGRLSWLMGTFWAHVK